AVMLSQGATASLIYALMGVVLLLSSIALYAVILGTIFLSKEPQDETQMPVAKRAPKNEHIPAILENWRLWIAVIIVSNIIMWVPVLMSAISLANGYYSQGYAMPNP
ncbi:MAG: hypothetical protein AAFV98_17800, partial [Chloroflexota bacterium]